MGQHVTTHGKTTGDPFNGADGRWVPITVNSAGQQVIAPLNGELSQFNRLAGGAIANYVNLTADGVISNKPCIVYGYVITTAMSAAVTNIYDNASAGSGTVLFQIPASAAVGATMFPVGIVTVNGAFADFLGTGTVNFLMVNG